MIRSKKTERYYRVLLTALSAGLLTACAPAETQPMESQTEISTAVDTKTDESAEAIQLPESAEQEVPEESRSDLAASENEFNSEDVYVIGSPILSDCLFLKVNMSDIKNIEDNLRYHSGEEFTDGEYFIYEAGDGITYVTHSTMNGDLYAIILTTDQFQLGCGLKVGMKEEEIASLKLPFVLCSKENYPMDSLFLADISCPFNTLDYDTTYLYQFGGIPKEAVKEDSIITGGRISITALVKDGIVINVFTNIPVAG